MFGFLSQKLSGLYQSFTAKSLSAKDLDPFLKEIEHSLLEADAPFESVETFLEQTKTNLLGKKYPQHLKAQQAIVKVLHESLTARLGGQKKSWQLNQPGPVRILMLGLQGTGKTTSSVKFAAWLKNQKKKVAIASLDIHRPAAREQTEILAKKMGIETIGFSQKNNIDLLIDDILKGSRYYDAVIIDTAGRTELNDDMMKELIHIERKIAPQHKFYVLDAMAGQSALAIASTFQKTVGITGVIVTKLDSDARAGAIIGIYDTLGVNVEFLSSGESVEKSQQWSIFHPERIAQRILGLGDMLSLIEKIEQSFSEKERKALEEKIIKSESSMNFEDLKNHLASLEKFSSQQGGMKNILSLIPGLSSMMGQISDQQIQNPMKKALAFIDSMTKKERLYPALLDQPGRKQRIAQGAGCLIQDLNALIKQLKKLSEMTKMMSNPAKMQGMLNALPQNLQDMLKSQEEK